MEELNEQLHMQLLDFDDGKRKEWVSLRKPFSVLFELTPRCNFNCIHCYLQESHASDELSYDEIIRIIDRLHDIGILFLTLTGGEVLTRSDFMGIYLYAKRRGFLVEVFTNGSLFDDEIIEMMAKYPPLLVDITLYGSTAETYAAVTGNAPSFKRVLENCEKLKRSNVRFSLKTTLMKPTLGELDAMKGIAVRFGVELVHGFDIVPTTEGCVDAQDLQVPLTVALANEFEDHLKRMDVGLASSADPEHQADQLIADDHVYTCNVATNSFLVDYRGNICPCMRLRHHGIPLLEADFDEVWADFAKYSQLRATTSFECVGCESRYYCDRCPAEADLIAGDPEALLDSACRVAHIRRLFYEGDRSIEECLKLAEG